MRKTNREAMRWGIGQQFKIGEFVYAKIFPPRKGIDQPRYDGPFKIVNVKGEWCYVLENCRTGRIVERNHYHIKKYKGKIEGISQNNNGRKSGERTPTSIWSATKDANVCDDNLGSLPEVETQHILKGSELQVPRRSCRERRLPDRYGQNYMYLDR
jgi:hypothetical protein